MDYHRHYATEPRDRQDFRLFSVFRVLVVVEPWSFWGSSQFSVRPDTDTGTVGQALTQKVPKKMTLIFAVALCLRTLSRTHPRMNEVPWKGCPSRPASRATVCSNLESRAQNEERRTHKTVSSSLNDLIRSIRFHVWISGAQFIAVGKPLLSFCVFAVTLHYSAFGALPAASPFSLLLFLFLLFFVGRQGTVEKRRNPFCVPTILLW